MSNQNVGMANFNAKEIKAKEAKKKLASMFFKKGITVAIISGMSYGLYSAFVTVAMGKGIWADWYSENTLLSVFAVTYIVGALGAALNDIMSAIWSWIMLMSKGKTVDAFRCVKTKPGLVMILAAAVGGPIAGTAYIIALQLAGSLAVPITALCPAIGAVLGKIIFKQELNKRMTLGVLICVVASALIGATGATGEVNSGVLLGILLALVAAFGWGVEGVVAGYGTSIIDSEIAIAIRQTASGFINLFILIPILGLLEGNIMLGVQLAGQAFTDAPSLIFFAVSGFFALFAFSLWYKGNSMCGAALGMACNGAYSFWGPFFLWIVMGIIMGIEGWTPAPVVWIGALIMIVGILLIAMDPRTLFEKGE